ncbi:MAG: hypothetical protein MUO89_03015 [Dehalococcoidia bacterium]|nr:hypothetical protein [Dehalococcoidia bacterium]
MAVEKLQEYIDSVDELQKAYLEVRKQGELIADVGRYLNNFPYKMIVSNVQVSFVATGERAFDLNADKWPSAKQVAETLSDYIKKRDKARNLYQSLSTAQREQIKPHPEI